jgi:hypothetical protein
VKTAHNFMQLMINNTIVELFWNKMIRLNSNFVNNALSSQYKYYLWMYLMSLGFDVFLEFIADCFVKKLFLISAKHNVKKH